MATTVNGNLIENKTGYSWRAVVNYTVNTSYSATHVQIKASLAFTAYANLGQVGSKIASNAVSLKGGGTARGSYTASSWTINNTSKTLISEQTWTVAKGTSATTHTVTGAITVDSSSAWKGTSTASVNVSIPALPSYTISYNSQGGTAKSSQTKYYGQAITTQSAPTKTGYSFEGWYWNNAGSKVNASTSWNGANATGTFYARWNANTYTVSYDKNASDATGTTAASSHTYDVAKALTLNGYTRTDYLFKGWSNTSDGGVTYADGQSVTNLVTSGTKTIYAVWRYQYTDPNIMAPSAFRVDSTTHAEDDTGDGACLIGTVLPATEEQADGTIQNVATTVQWQYRETGTSQWTDAGTAQTITDFTLTSDTVLVLNKLYYTRSGNAGAYFYTQVDSPDVSELSTYYELLNPVYVSSLNPDVQYDVQMIATYTTDSGTIKTKSRMTSISKAEFLMDFAAEGNSAAFFAPAEDGLKNKLFINGDILIFIDEYASLDSMDADVLLDARLKALFDALDW